MYIHMCMYTKTMKKSHEIEKEPVYLGREVTEETNNIMTLQFQKIEIVSMQC